MRKRKMKNLKFGERRIVRANESLRITLPPAWYNSLGLGEGDTISIEMLPNGRLVLIPSKNDRLAQGIAKASAEMESEPT
jgi:antitoxin component of MazEF toxin-antitoxin module